jgi:hypothetical protein
MPVTHPHRMSSHPAHTTEIESKTDLSRSIDGTKVVRPGTDSSLSLRTGSERVGHLERRVVGDDLGEVCPRTIENVVGKVGHCSLASASILRTGKRGGRGTDSCILGRVPQSCPVGRVRENHGWSGGGRGRNRRGRGRQGGRRRRWECPGRGR